MSEEVIEIECFELEQPIGKFYVGKIKWFDLLSIARKDIERIRVEGAGGIEGYMGIQRELSKKRLKEISQYVSFEDSTFPNSIVISIDSITYIDDDDVVIENIVSFDGKILKLRNNGRIAKIIDGQHRIFGIEKYIEENSLFRETFVFDLIVTIFIDIDEEYQSSIFATINKAQTKVNKSLVYDLYSLAKTRSP
uniref:DGQHR domain-containing protein n=1 Tax=uncultured Planktosalinus sp. TaxID=1810935 RepID=UPI0030D9097B